MIFADMLAKSADAVGMTGVVLLLIAYYALSTNKLSAHSMGYQLLNFLGAAGILFSLFYAWNTSAVVIELAWIVISLIGMYRILRGQQKEKSAQIHILNNAK
ncbi:CBU_0592 family membrane protein [Aquicella lusitana]|jgi:hypothetical protein|uniref:CBU-0592-like domain-containing protein n=1 Tax=Aquicella lusitana TaxID=254246 RepID=A0A370GR67_9COXI|nr:hypothetical protein [Aquicella lusitana]RDI46001.1 hypothetical protein C8D86_1065 [Aquicella lusitana]VVC73402.1 hypothetical protein AQULUS_11410 [Aquicella lusitana]